MVDVGLFRRTKNPVSIVAPVPSLEIQAAVERTEKWNDDLAETIKLAKEMMTVNKPRKATP